MSDPFGYDYMMSRGGRLGWGGNSHAKTCRRNKEKKYPGPFCYPRAVSPALKSLLAGLSTAKEKAKEKD